MTIPILASKGLSRKLLILFVGCWLFISAVQQILGSVVPIAKLEQLQTGMTKASVIALIGKPSVIVSDDTWDYEKWSNSGWCRVSFDHEGQLVGVDNEIAGAGLGCFD